MQTPKDRERRAARIQLGTILLLLEGLPEAIDDLMAATLRSGSIKDGSFKQKTYGLNVLIDSINRKESKNVWDHNAAW